MRLPARIAQIIIKASFTRFLPGDNFMNGSESIAFAEPQPWEARIYVADAFGDRALEILRKLEQEVGRRRNGLF